MKTQKEIFSWLRGNLGPHCLGGLTSTDAACLVTSVNLTNLICSPKAPPPLFAAYRAIIEQMLPHNRRLAYHAIACELDWGQRDMIWTAAACPPLDNPGRCKFE
jgi:hypothetical protein